MKFERSIYIQRPPEDVFLFLRDKDLLPQPAESPVLRLEKTTPGPVAVGTRYCEVVQMFPFWKGDILSEVKRYEPPFHLEEAFHGASMQGYLAYIFQPIEGGTLLIQQETVQFKGLLTIFTPIMERMLLKKIDERLVGIQHFLERGREATS